LRWDEREGGPCIIAYSSPHFFSPPYSLSSPSLSSSSFLSSLSRLLQEVKERVFGMSDAATAMHIILGRDPSFDMNGLLAAIKYDAPVVVKAFLTHDLATLRQHCGPELLERFEGIFEHFQAQVGGGWWGKRGVCGRRGGGG
jgi:hypothetical protein